MYKKNSTGSLPKWARAPLKKDKEGASARVATREACVHDRFGVTHIHVISLSTTEGDTAAPAWQTNCRPCSKNLTAVTWLIKAHRVHPLNSTHPFSYPAPSLQGPSLVCTVHTTTHIRYLIPLVLWASESSSCTTFTLWVKTMLILKSIILLLKKLGEVRFISLHAKCSKWPQKKEA